MRFNENRPLAWAVLAVCALGSVFGLGGSSLARERDRVVDYFYDGADTPVRWEAYDASGAPISYTIPQFENGEMRSAQTFDPQGKLIAEDVVNEDGSILTYTYND